MNEVTWQHVMAWEALHAGECAKPQLLRFTGRPDELRCALLMLCVWHAVVTVHAIVLRALWVGPSLRNPRLQLQKVMGAQSSLLCVQPVGATKQLVWRAAALRPA